MPKKLDLSNPVQREAHWTGVASKQLLGKRIVAVRYMTKNEADQLGWDTRPIVIQLDDGNVLYPSMDDEGNGPGSLFTNNEQQPTLPVLY